MGHEYERGVARFMTGEQKLDDLAPCRLVEIAGRLIRDQDRGMRRKGTRKRDTLLLATGQLGRIVVHAIAQADRGKLGCGAIEGVGLACKLERHGDILECRHGGDEMEALEYDSDIFAAEAGEGILIE